MYIVRLFGLKSKLCSWRLLGYPGVVPRTRSCMRTTRAMGCSAWSADTYQRFDLACPVIAAPTSVVLAVLLIRRVPPS